MTDWKNGRKGSSLSNRLPKKDNNEPVSFEIVEHIATLSTNEKGWRKELNIVSWNGTEPKFDIRSWKDDYSGVGKGVTIFEDEMIVLKDAIQKLNFKKESKED